MQNSKFKFLKNNFLDKSNFSIYFNLFYYFIFFVLSIILLISKNINVDYLFVVSPILYYLILIFVVTILFVIFLIIYNYLIVFLGRLFKFKKAYFLKKEIGTYIGFCFMLFGIFSLLLFSNINSLLLNIDNFYLIFLFSTVILFFVNLNFKKVNSFFSFLQEFYLKLNSDFIPIVVIFFISFLEINVFLTTSYDILKFSLDLFLLNVFIGGLTFWLILYFIFYVILKIKTKFILNGSFILSVILIFVYLYLTNWNGIIVSKLNFNLFYIALLYLLLVILEVFRFIEKNNLNYKHDGLKKNGM